MMRTTSLLVAALSASFMRPTPPADTPPGPGVPLTLAEERAKRIKDVRYDLQLSIPAEASAPVTGRVTISFQLTDASRPLALDFAPRDCMRGARVGGKPVTLATTVDHLIVPAAELRDGRNEISIDFVAGNASLNRNPGRSVNVKVL